MCGIAGFADSTFGGRNGQGSQRLDAEFNLVHRMCEVIRHRGPDDEGIHVEPGVGLGMRRLSIIDLAGGQQPIHNEDRHRSGSSSTARSTTTASCARELESLGHRFYTSSDTESIVHAYEQWGEDAFRRLRGMFGIALWDEPKRTLLLARDRAGIKPLHYAERGGRLYFGTEIKSLLAAGAVDPRARPRRARSLPVVSLHAARRLDLRRRPEAPAGPPPALARRPAPRSSSTGRWRRRKPSAGTEAEAVEALQRRPRRTRSRSHMVSDVPLGAFLSGGVDSSRRRRHDGARLVAPGQDVLDRLRRPGSSTSSSTRGRSRRHFGTDHHEFVVSPDGLSILDGLIGHFDEPFADSSAIPTWYVSEIARRHVTVVLSGDGGDELFGGYDRYLPHPRVAQFDRMPLPGAARRRRRWRGRCCRTARRGKNFLRHVGRDAARPLPGCDRVLPARREAGALHAAGVRPRAGGWIAEAALARHFDRFAALPHDSQMMRFDFETYLPEDVLTKVDRMSMAHSIESRVPLLDNRVIDFAASLPAAFKIRNGRRKHVLKEALQPTAAAGILIGRSRGSACRSTSGSAAVFASSSPTRCVAAHSQRGYFEPAFVRRLVKEHLAGRARSHAPAVATGGLRALAPAVPRSTVARRRFQLSNPRSIRWQPRAAKVLGLFLLQVDAWHPACSGGQRVTVHRPRFRSRSS